ncbi:MAG: radical SAM protein [Clostridiales bacterium]|nr:radical SAM protein [Clostridiales bacterium]
MNFSKDILVLLEPTNACNLRCLHCYHADTGYDTKIMEIGTLERFLSILAPNYSTIKIIWHGGEPLLAGFEFFEKAYKMFDTFSNKFDCKFRFNLQTNGTLLTDEFIVLFQANKTSISISYDGPYNSYMRQQTEKVEKVIAKLQEQGVPFSCLATVSSKSINHLLDMYECFKQRNIPVKFNHIFPDGAAKQHEDFSLSKEEWTNNFIELFNYWLYDKKCNIRVASCVDLLHQYFGVKSGCLNHGCLFRYIAIDAYGDIYPCGRLIKDGFKLANVFEISDVREAFLSKPFLNILKDNEIRITSCKKCKWITKCNSGCNASCLLDGSLQRKSSFECYVTNMVYDNIEVRLSEIDLCNINPYAQKIIKENLTK